MGKIYFVRHARSRTNPDVPPSAWPLTPEGHRAASRLGRHIAWEEVTQVASSSELKAQQTAAALAQVGGLPWRTVDGLHELKADWFDTPDELSRRFDAFLTGAPDAAFESREHALSRFAQAVTEIYRKAGHNSAVIVTHGRILTVYFRAVLGPNVNSVAWQQLKFPDLAVYDPEDNRMLSGFFRS